MAKVGDIALCQHGIEGVITKIEGSAVTGILYTGHQKNNPKEPWQSNNPKVIGNIDVLKIIDTEETKSISEN